MTSLYGLKSELKRNKADIRSLKKQPYHRMVNQNLDPDFFEGTIDSLIAMLTPLSDNGFGRLTYEYIYDYDEFDHRDRRIVFIYSSTHPLEGEELEAAVAHRTELLQRLQKRNETLEKQIAKLEMTEAEKERSKFAAWAKAHPEDAKKIIE